MNHKLENSESIDDSNDTRTSNDNSSKRVKLSDSIKSESIKDELIDSNSNSNSKGKKSSRNDGKSALQDDAGLCLCLTIISGI